MRRGKIRTILSNLEIGKPFTYYFLQGQDQEVLMEGLLFFVNQSKLSFMVEKKEFEDDDLECVLLKIKSNLNVEVNLFVSYIPPGKDDQLKLFSDKLSNSRLKNIVVLGDLNAKSAKWNNSQVNSGGLIVEEMMTKCKSYMFE